MFYFFFFFLISEDTNLTKALISLLFSASFQAKDNIILLREIARDIHSSLGDIDQVGDWFYLCKHIILLSEIARDIHSNLGDFNQLGGWFLVMQVS